MADMRLRMGHFPLTLETTSIRTIKKMGITITVELTKHQV